MNDYASLRKTKNTTRTIAVVIAVLFVVEMCSLTMFFSRVASFSNNALGYVISLTEGAANTKLSKIDASDTGFIIPTAVVDPDTLIEPEDVVNDAAHDFGFRVSDKDQIWTTSTDIDFFHLSYDETGKTTVVSMNGDKVVAPGTGDTYIFTLSNTGDQGLRYLVYIEADINAYDLLGNELYIPLTARFRKGDGTFFVGDSSDNWPDYTALDKSGDLGALSSGENANYYVDWLWPFERFDGAGLDANDAYDTMLGQLAADGSRLEASILIKTVAWIDETEEPTEAPSETAPVGSEATVAPSEATEPTVAPSEPTVAPSEPTVAPTVAPTTAPTVAPTTKPTQTPTTKPTVAPTTKPTTKPTVAPTTKPTTKPTVAPTTKPTTKPTVAPTTKPTTKPTTIPTTKPTAKPTTAPETKPTAAPPTGPTEHGPTAGPTSPSTKPTQANPTDSTDVTQVTPTDETTNPSESVAPSSSDSTVSPSGVPSTQIATTSPTQPKTGDASRYVFWLILSIVVFVAIIVLFVIYRKMKKAEKAARQLNEK